MTPYNNDKAGRQAVLAALQSLLDSGLTSGTSGNVSVQTDAGMLITPTGVAPQNLRDEHIVAMAHDGTTAAGQLRASSEWRMHADIYRNKPGVNAVVHCHSKI